MENADNQDNTSQEAAPAQSQGKVEQELATVRAQLEAMNQQFAEQMRTLANAVKPPTPSKIDVSDDDIYDPKKLVQVSKEIAREAVAKERELNSMIYTLAQDYPEIQTDSNVRKAVLEAHNSLPEGLRDSAAGYEMAVLKAVSKAGLVAKSKRSNIDPDISAGSGRGTSSRPASKKGISEKTRALAELFGRDVNDKNVLKGLEEAANRDSYGKWR